MIRSLKSKDNQSLFQKPKLDQYISSKFYAKTRIKNKEFCERITRIDPNTITRLSYGGGTDRLSFGDIAESDFAGSLAAPRAMTPFAAGSYSSSKKSMSSLFVAIREHSWTISVFFDFHFNNLERDIKSRSTRLQIWSDLVKF